jgi:hypothetical protein
LYALQKKAIAIAVRNISGRRRWSKLAEWLRPGQPAARQIGEGLSQNPTRRAEGL